MLNSVFNRLGWEACHFQRLFEAVIGQMVRAEICPPGVETWLNFAPEVKFPASLSVSPADSRGERVRDFYFRGSHRVAMQRALQLSSLSTLNVSWMSLNSSWSEFIYSRER